MSELSISVWNNRKRDMGATHTTPVSTSTSTLTGLFLRYVLLLRAFALSGQIATFVVAYYVLAVTPPVVPVVIVIMVLSAFTVFSWWRIKAGLSGLDQSILVQLLVDVLALTVLLYLTGGSVNPFVSLFLLPVTVAAASLRPGYTWLIAAIAAICYTVLMFVHLPAPQWGYTDHHHFTFHLWGMWFGFVLSAGVVAYFVAKMGNTLRAHDQELARAREKALQVNQLIALGMLAAGTAHQLGTPLATMAVVVKEMEHEHANMPALMEKLRLIRGQIDRCKEILSRMAIQAGQAQADAGRPVTLDRYLEETIREWRGLRPGISVQTHWVGPRPAPRIIADRTLTQAIINVLNNAADAAVSTVEVEARWEQDKLELEIRDDGVGLASAIRDHIGKPFVTTKPAGKGMGLGLYLAQTTLNRLGGNLELSERVDAGVCAKIVLPLSPLLATDHS